MAFSYFYNSPNKPVAVYGKSRNALIVKAEREGCEITIRDAEGRGIQIINKGK
tara:strand:- start:21236 stop:21394 length:159 start_codon:yes stop_codon:yes gene_type:complete